MPDWNQLVWGMTSTARRSIGTSWSIRTRSRPSVPGSSPSRIPLLGRHGGCIMVHSYSMWICFQFHTGDYHRFYPLIQFVQILQSKAYSCNTSCMCKHACMHICEYIHICICTYMWRCQKHCSPIVAASTVMPQENKACLRNAVMFFLHMTNRF